MEIQAIRDAAISELIYPIFALTRQFLAVNEIVLKENRPFIEDMLLKEEEKVAEVYFPIEGERYYFVVSMEKGSRQFPEREWCFGYSKITRSISNFENNE